MYGKETAFDMKCQKCGADIPEGKFYCENCGNAIQIVPDYNPVDDISIVTEENTDKKTGSSESQRIPTDETGARPMRYRWRFGAAAVILAVLGILVFQISYHLVLQPQDTLADADSVQPILLEKPQFSIAPGQYDHSLRLSISHERRNEGIIYYTTDGTTPGEQSEIYNRPIGIDEGKTVIRAVFILADGTQSEEADGTYEVTFDYPDEPIFSVDSGDYTGGFYVSLYAEEDCKIYYTTNGEEPGYDSKLYRGPIYISPGLAVIRAVSVDEYGGMSGIVEAIYNVSENFTPSEEKTEQLPEGEPVIP